MQHADSINRGSYPRAILAILAIWPLVARAQNEPIPLQLSIIKAQHLRVTVTSDVQRFAVGNPDTLSAEPLNSRELLLLGKSPGRTTLLVWFRDASIQEYLVTVHRDLGLLEMALKRIHPAIEAEIAPDRDAIVLTGTVPDISYLRAAEAAAHSYLDATQTNTNNPVLVRNSQQPLVPPVPGQPAAETVRVPITAAAAPVSGTVINLIQVERLPLLADEKIVEAIREVGGAQVTVSRILKGQLPDDTQDVFLFSGRVPNQVALTRILTVASHILTGQAINEQDIRVIADESGGLATQIADAAGSNTGGGISGGVGGSSLGGSSAINLVNRVRKNIARAKALQAAGGRIVSFMEVSDLPQVRVDIRLIEIDRTKLKNYNPSISTLLGSPRTIRSLLPNPVSSAVQGPPATDPNTGIRTGAPNIGPGNAVQSVLGFLNGSLTTGAQLTTSHFALDAILTLLEQAGIARSLSSPSLTVLSGEQATFQVGGQIPVPQVTTTGVTAQNVVTSVIFIPYGIGLKVLPLIGDDDMLTLEVLPEVLTPDTTLTASIRDSTGTNQLTTAFKDRSLKTSARLLDGQSLIIGGLLSRTTDDTQASTPGLRDAPGLGWLFKNLSRTDDTTELMIVVNPSIVRDQIPNVNIWEFPKNSDFTTLGKQERPLAAVPAVAVGGTKAANHP